VTALVVQVAPFYPPHLGGVENTAQIIAESLAATRRVEVLTSTCGAEGAPRVERRDRLTVRRLRATEVASTPVMPALAGALLRLPRDCVVHVHVAQALTPEIVWITSRLRRRPFVAHFHLDVDPSGPAGRWLALYKRLLLARVLRAASCVIVLSAGQASFVAGRYRVRQDRIAVIPNGVSPGLTPPAPEPLPAPEPPPASGLSPASAPAPASGASGDIRPGPAPLRLLFVGRLSPQKNVPRLLEALHLMRQPAELVLVGDGPEQDGLAALAARLGLVNARFAGREDRTALAARYRWADVFVLSSDKEGMPLAALEAMSFGLPVVATDVPGLRELCATAGLLVPPDPAALARALDSLATDPEARRRLGRQSLTLAGDLSWERSLARIEGLYLEVAR
jgi:glycosyltransferase involved in cell wall biosynthesis